MEPKKIGVLLMNLGTPDNPSPKALRRYLKVFLDDPRVVDLPRLARKILLYGVLLPFRARQSAKAYQAVWDAQKGSPLLYHSNNLTKALSAHLGENYQVALGMRYGQPSIKQALSQLQSCQKIILLPLFPQYSSAATGSALEDAFKQLGLQWNMPSVVTCHQFYDDNDFLDAKASILSPLLQSNDFDKVVFSYHSLPQRHIDKSTKACGQHCRQQVPCAPIQTDTAWCYRAQCYHTSRALAERLSLSSTDYTVAFQSRLGRTVWVGPDIEQVLQQSRAEGVKNILVSCPSFVADCLETLEEIGMRAKERWQALGGERFVLAPCLNDEPQWVAALGRLVSRYSLKEIS